MYDNGGRVKILVVGLLLTLFILSVFILIPIARGYGASLSYGNDANMGTLAQLTQAKEDLYRTLPDIFIQGGSAAVQLAMALTVVFLGGGVGLLLTAISFNLGAKGYVGVIQAKHDIEAGPMPKIRTLSNEGSMPYSGGKLGSSLSNNRQLITDHSSEGNQSRHVAGGHSRNAEGSGRNVRSPEGRILYHPRPRDADIPTYSETFSPGTNTDDC